jgi:hypothetical protein
MQRLQRLAADRGQAKAALAAEALGPLQRFRRVVTVLMGVAAAPVAMAMVMDVMIMDVMIMCVMVMAVMVAGLCVWLHVGRVALQKDIGQFAAILQGPPTQAPAWRAT